MRPLTAEEIVRARQLGARLWRREWLAQLPRAVFFLLILVIGYRVLRSALVVAALVLVWLLFSGPLLIWRRHRMWRRDLRYDLADGMAVQTAGKVYDRFHFAGFFPYKRLVVLVEGGELQLDRGRFKEIHLGDTIQVDYLPRTSLVIAARREAPTLASGWR